MRVPHAIDKSTIVTTDLGTFGFCNVCAIPTKLFVYTATKTHNVSYRCSVPIIENRATRKRTRALPAVKPVSFDGDMSLWADEQNGNCKMCNEHARWNPQRNARALFLVPINGSAVLKGLFCNDCRLLLGEHMSQRNQQLMRDIVSAGHHVVSPPHK